MATPLLTAGRQAVWAAIEADASVMEAIRTRWKFEEKGGFNPPTSLNDLPALGIRPAPSGSVNATWVTNQEQKIEYNLQFMLWTFDWTILQQEDIWERITRALWTGFDRSGSTDPGQGRKWRMLESSLPQESLTDPEKGPVICKWVWNTKIMIGRWNPRLPAQP